MTVRGVRPARIATASSPSPHTLASSQSSPPTMGISASARRITRPMRNAMYLEEDRITKRPTPCVATVYPIV